MTLWPQTSFVWSAKVAKLLAGGAGCGLAAFGCSERGKAIRNRQVSPHKRLRGRSTDSSSFGALPGRPRVRSHCLRPITATAAHAPGLACRGLGGAKPLHSFVLDLFRRVHE